MVLVAFCVDGNAGEDAKVGTLRAGFITNVDEYDEVTVFAPESVTTTFASSGELEVSADVVWKV